jgi:hypothetical protein
MILEAAVTARAATVVPHYLRDFGPPRRDFELEL